MSLRIVNLLDFRNKPPMNYLNPQTLRLEAAPDGTLRLQIEDDRCGLNVEVLRAFPLSHPDENLVFRDGGGAELGVLETLAQLPAEGQQLANEQLARRYFLPKITKIHSIFERFGSSIWEVETDRGPVTISSKPMNESLFEISPRRYILRDLQENRYEIRDVNELDEDSRARFAGKY